MRGPDQQPRLLTSSGPGRDRPEPATRRTRSARPGEPYTSLGRRERPSPPGTRTSQVVLGEGRGPCRDPPLRPQGPDLLPQPPQLLGFLRRQARAALRPVGSRVLDPSPEPRLRQIELLGHLGDLPSSSPKPDRAALNSSVNCRRGRRGLPVTATRGHRVRLSECVHEIGSSPGRLPPGLTGHLAALLPAATPARNAATATGKARPSESPAAASSPI